MRLDLNNYLNQPPKLKILHIDINTNSNTTIHKLIGSIHVEPPIKALDPGIEDILLHVNMRR